MLEHVGWPTEGNALRAAVRASVAAKQTTKDVGGSLGTREAGEWMANYIAKQGTRP